ncbi:hypothetical protein Cadr_000026315 [Camelus dromedarius]|uniref:Uncharacterized protein n=1 Tax=Camelus dromedarius TaxID=9838 RepID=A0A5N4CEL1_CAMDR|nr:hypothetical protein Cadr_000026315 [Camelus dromedarius]
MVQAGRPSVQRDEEGGTGRLAGGGLSWAVTTLIVIPGSVAEPGTQTEAGTQTEPEIGNDSVIKDQARLAADAEPVGTAELRREAEKTGNMNRAEDTLLRPVKSSRRIRGGSEVTAARDGMPKPPSLSRFPRPHKGPSQQDGKCIQVRGKPEARSQRPGGTAHHLRAGPEGKVLTVART